MDTYIGFDIETTGLEDSDEITEVGMVVQSPNLDKPLAQFSIFMHDKSYPEITEEIFELTGITQKLLETRGDSPKDGLSACLQFIELFRPEFLVAHNAHGFDRPFFLDRCIRHLKGVETWERCREMICNMHWVDTATDIKFPRNIKSRSLGHLAADHGFLNPFPHDALSDVRTMLKILNLYDMNRVLKRSRESSYLAIAKVSYGERNLAKERGFYWDGEKKYWFKNIKETELIELQKDKPFPCDVKRIKDEYKISKTVHNKTLDGGVLGELPLAKREVSGNPPTDGAHS